MSYRALIPVVAGLTVLVAVAVSTLVEVERDARRRARQGRGGQSVRATESLPPRPSSPSGPPTGTVTARGGRFGPPPTDLPEPTPVPDDEIAASCRRLFDLHGGPA